MNNRNTTNVPERLITKADLKVGDVLVFRPIEDIKALERVKCLVYGWDDKMVRLLDKEYVVTQEMLDYSGERIDRVEIDGWIYTVGISMLKLKNAEETTEGEKEEMTEETPFTANIVTPRSEQSAAIIDEMKRLVDKKRLKNLLSIAATQNDNRHIVDDCIVEDYLDIWAHAKYDYFLLFGKQLRIETSVEVEMTDSDVSAKLKEVFQDFPMYGLTLDRFEINEYRENVIKYNHDSVMRYAKDQYKIGMKLSKFIANFIKNPQLDIAISKVMQDKTATHNVYVSIDPYDYLTMSLNQHDWDSCHRITDGCYATGALSYLLDSATMIAYRENGKEYDYNYFGLKFKGNSKSWRQCVYFDPKTCSIIFGRQYPNIIDPIAKAIRIKLEDTVAEYINAPQNLWRVMSDTMDAYYNDESNLHYSDVENDYPYKFVKLKCVTEQGNFYVGYDAPCLLCGEEGGIENGSVGVCCECRDENDYYEED